MPHLNQKLLDNKSIVLSFIYSSLKSFLTNIRLLSRTLEISIFHALELNKEMVFFMVCKSIS